MRIFEITQQIRGFSPVEIYIDNKKVWSNDIDLTNLSDEEGYELVRKNKRKYHEVLSRHDLVKNISFEIKHEHHSIVKIITEKEE